MVTAATSIAVVSGGPASASCNHGYVDKELTSGQVIGAGTTGLAVRTGPHLSCGLVGRVPTGHWVTYLCHVYGDVVNSTNHWVRIHYNNGGPTSIDGWAAEDYLSDASVAGCG
ncbi:SH3 domain-containing protein [Micromonospora sp. C31]|uniref:SH3 domain-containing protein n=1 Tax=Micromonospora sp. C31 TaxID=2824876 RepID=UPI001B35DB23|nr:SH3 domain-containing protein [Micromonospora sp. C31]MBQ1073487.1 SH3 domain-containing protein [Micromonospora sp. C31]